MTTLVSNKGILNTAVYIYIYSYWGSQYNTSEFGRENDEILLEKIFFQKKRLLICNRISAIIKNVNLRTRLVGISTLYEYTERVNKTLFLQQSVLHTHSFKIHYNNYLNFSYGTYKF